MAPFLIVLSTLLYLFNGIYSAPLKNVDDDYEVFGFIAEKRFEDPKQESHRDRTKRTVAVADDGSGFASACESGKKFVLVKEPTCLVKKTQYHAYMKLCVIQHAYVPGMPDGEKGANYMAFRNNLYKFYGASEIYRKKYCPDRTTTPSTSSTVSTNPTQSTHSTVSTKPTQSTNSTGSTKPTQSTNSTSSTKPTQSTNSTLPTNTALSKNTTLSMNTKLSTNTTLIPDTKLST